MHAILNASKMSDVYLAAAKTSLNTLYAWPLNFCKEIAIFVQQEILLFNSETVFRPGALKSFNAQQR